MRPKEYLSQAQRLKKRYESALEDLEYIRTMADGVGAIRYDKDRVQASPENDRLADYMIRLERAESRVLHAAETYFSAYEDISGKIGKIMPGLYSDVLYLRYIRGMQLMDVAEDLNYSYEYIKHIHGLALVQFGKRFPEVLKDDTQ